jgi:signal transduction histidine kinase
MRFFTNISHEIRTPLTLIYSPLDKVLQNTGLDEKTQKSLSLVKKNVERLLNLTNQLLHCVKLILVWLNRNSRK